MKVRMEHIFHILLLFVLVQAKKKCIYSFPVLLLLDSFPLICFEDSKIKSYTPVSNVIFFFRFNSINKICFAELVSIGHHFKKRRQEDTCRHAYVKFDGENRECPKKRQKQVLIFEFFLKKLHFSLLIKDPSKNLVTFFYFL